MSRRIFRLLVALLALAWVTPVARADAGTLVIVGGGLKPDNAEVFAAFLDARPAANPWPRHWPPSWE